MGGALAVALAAASPVAAAPLGRALDHLAARQDRFGGGLSARTGTDALHTGWGALAVVAAGEDPRRWRRGGPSLRAAVARPLRRPLLGDIQRTAVAAAAAGLDPRRVGGRDLVRIVLRAQGADGVVGDGPATTAWAILALRAAGLPAGARPIRAAAAALERAQRGDGGWSITPEAPGSGPNTAAAAVQALVAAGRTRRAPSLRRARSFLRRAQNADGGFSAVVGGQSTALTTGWVVLAIRALGERPGRAPWRRGGGPLALLRALQLPDGGVRNARDSAASSTWATAQSALAFAGRPLPLRPRFTRPTPLRAPRVVALDPARGARVAGALVVRYRDDRDGTGIDPAAVRLRIGGRDLTARARVTPTWLRLPSSLVPSGAVSVELLLADRAGNRRVTRWSVIGPGR